jgi:hypothetical protein
LQLFANVEGKANRSVTEGWRDRRPKSRRVFQHPVKPRRPEPEKTWALVLRKLPVPPKRIYATTSNQPSTLFGIHLSARQAGERSIFAA